MPKLPKCNSTQVYKAGFNAKGKQLFLCRNCLKRFQVKVNVFSESVERAETINNVPDGVIPFFGEHSFNEFSFQGRKDVGSHKLSITAKNLNTLPTYNRELEAAEMQQQTTPKTETPHRMSNQTFKGKLVEFAVYLKKNGKAETKIKSQSGLLKTLHNLGANLYDCESIKETMASQNWSNGMKKNIVNAYKNFAAYMGFPLPKMPEYKQQSKIPFIPNESELDQLIACAGPKLQPFLQTLKETFARTGEIAALKWRDIDLERHIITVNDAEKNSNPRQIEISDKLAVMLKRLPKTNDLVFGENATKRMRKLFHWTRTRLAYRTQNPRIKQIHLHSFRHWGATMLYHDTKDPFLVMERLGHKSITSTQIYIKLLNTGNREEYVSKVAVTLEEAQTLIESGFEYVTSMRIGETTYQLFRKKKPWRPN
jgi:integrase